MASRGVGSLVLDIIGFLASFLTTLPPIPRVWGLRHVPDIGLARRCQWWLLASLFHSFTAIMITVKEFLIVLKEQNLHSVEMDHVHLASLFVRFLGPFFVLIVSIVLLASLVRHYPITQDVWMTRFIIGFGCIGYLSILLTDFICFKITIALEVVLIPVTICMHVLRFASQVVPFIFSLIGFTPVLCLIPLGEKFLANLALKIATLVGAVFRLFDAIVIRFHTTREAVNYFRSRLQECVL